MTPLHPFAAVAAGTMLGLAALTAPNTVPTQGLGLSTGCETSCLQTAGPHPQVGAMVMPDKVHVITAPGRYGLAEPPAGQRYAVIAGYLVRIEAMDGPVRSILRPVPRILD